MKLLRFRLPLLIGLSILISSSSIAPDDVTPDLKGSWTLKAIKKGDEKGFSDQPKEVIKKKIITDSHFSWYEYDPSGKLIALGGGTYKLEGNTYTETIEYFYPAGSSLLGTSIPFSCKMETKDKWIHTGFIREREIDSSTGLYVETTTEKIEEIWERE